MASKPRYLKDIPLTDEPSGSTVVLVMPNGFEARTPIADITDELGLADVATSGDYNDLINTPGNPDASDVGFTPSDINDWDGGADPGNTDGALDQLAERVSDIEGVGGSVTSVGVAGTDGLQVDSGSPITTSGVIQLGVNATAMRAHLNVEDGSTADQTGAEIKSLYENEPNTNAYTDAEKSKLTGVEAGATADQTGAEIKSLYEGQANTNSYTDAEKSKLAGLDGSHFQGVYNSLAALNIAHPTGVPGDYAHVDLGAGQDVVLYIWDDSDLAWIEQLGQSTAETAASIKTKYESNPDTNAYTDAEKAKVSQTSGINTGDQDLSGLALLTDPRFTDERVPTSAGLTGKFGTAKGSIVDADRLVGLDSAASNAPKHWLWSTIKSTLKTYFDTLYNLYVLPVATTTTIGGVKRNVGVAGQYITGYDSAGNALFGTPTGGGQAGSNLLINGDFSVNNRSVGTVSLPSGGFPVDRFYVLASTGNVSGGVATRSGDGRDKALQINSTALMAKYGVVQIIEAVNCVDAIGKTVTLSFNINLASGRSVKAAIISWSGSRDEIPRNFVSLWNAAGVLPTLAPNTTYENVPTGLVGIGGWSSFQTSAVIDAPGAKNIAIMIWDDTTTGTIPFELDRVKLEIGTSATPFERIQIADQIAQCQRYYEVLRYNTAGQVAVATGPYNQMTWYFKATKRATPTTSLVTGTWNVATPTFSNSVDSCTPVGGGAFYANGTQGQVGLAADAELGI